MVTLMKLFLQVILMPRLTAILRASILTVSTRSPTPCRRDGKGGRYDTGVGLVAPTDCLDPCWSSWLSGTTSTKISKLSLVTKSESINNIVSLYFIYHTRLTTLVMFYIASVHRKRFVYKICLNHPKVYSGWSRFG